MQSKIGSAVETATNIATGFLISMLLNATLLPALGYNVTVQENLIIVVSFTVVSAIRSYALRRFFNWFGSRTLNDK
jgi:hypothetical protein